MEYRKYVVAMVTTCTYNTVWTNGISSNYVVTMVTTR